MEGRKAKKVTYSKTIVMDRVTMAEDAKKIKFNSVELEKLALECQETVRIVAYQASNILKGTAEVFCSGVECDTSVAIKGDSDYVRDVIVAFCGGLSKKYLSWSTSSSPYSDEFLLAGNNLRMVAGMIDGVDFKLYPESLSQGQWPPKEVEHVPDKGASPDVVYLYYEKGKALKKYLRATYKSVELREMIDNNPELIVKKSAAKEEMVNLLYDYAKSEVIKHHDEKSSEA